MSQSGYTVVSFTPPLRIILCSGTVHQTSCRSIGCFVVVVSCLHYCSPMRAGNHRISTYLFPNFTSLSTRTAPLNTVFLASFAISHVSYIAPFHNWGVGESKKVNAIIQKVYKAALGLSDNTNTEKLLELGTHNTLEEIIEAQKTAQLNRLAKTSTGRKNTREDRHKTTGNKCKVPGADTQGNQKTPDSTAHT